MGWYVGTGVVGAGDVLGLGVGVGVGRGVIG